MRNIVMVAGMALAWASPPLHAQTEDPALFTSARLGPLQFTVVDLRPGDGVAPSYSLDGLPALQTTVLAYDDFVGRGPGISDFDNDLGWNASVAADSPYGTAVGSVDGFAMTTGSAFAFKTLRVGSVRLWTAGMPSGPPPPGTPIESHITVAPGTALTISATTELAAGCPPPVFCLSIADSHLTLLGPGGSASTDTLQLVGNGTRSDVLSVSFANLSDTAAALAFEAAIEIHLAVPEPSTVLLFIAGLLALTTALGAPRSHRGPGSG